MSGRTRRLAFAGALLAAGVAIAGAVGTPPPAPPRSGEGSRTRSSLLTALRVRSSGKAPLLLLLAPGLSLDDLNDSQYPHLGALAGQCAVGWMNVTTVPGHTDLASACLTLGAGVRVVAPSGGPLAITARRLPAAERTRLVRPAGPAPGGLLAGRAARVATADPASADGRLGELLAGAGRRVGAAIAGHRSGGGELFLTVMDRWDSVPAGSVGAPLLRRAPERPYGIAADGDALARLALRLIEACDLVAVDPGDMERARRYRPLCLAARAREHARAALRDLDRLVGILWPRVRVRGGTMLLISPVPPTDGWGPFGLLMATGQGWPPGWLASGSTRIPGLVTNTDFLPTVLAVTGVAISPLSIPGRAVRATGAGKPADLRRLAIWSTRAELVRAPAWSLLRAALLLLVGVAAIPQCRRHAGPLLPAPMLLMLLLLLAGDLVAPPTPLRAAAHGLVGLAAVATALRYWLSGRRTASRPTERRAPSSEQCLLFLTGATALLLLGELLTGGHLLRWSPLGYSLALGARYYGIGNEAIGVLLGASLLLPFAASAVLPDHRRAVVWGGALLYGVTLGLVGSPAAGSDFGGALAAAVGFTLALPALAGRRLRARHALAALAAFLAVAALFAIWDSARPPADRTHLGRLVTAVRAGGLEPLAAVVAGKAITAARVTFGLWGAIALAEAAVGLALLRAAPAASPLRAGLALLVPTAVALLLFNDSGVIAAALALAPFPIAAAALVEELPARPADGPGFRQNTE